MFQSYGQWKHSYRVPFFFTTLLKKFTTAIHTESFQRVLTDRPLQKNNPCKLQTGSSLNFDPTLSNKSRTENLKWNQIRVLDWPRQSPVSTPHSLQTSALVTVSTYCKKMSYFKQNDLPV